MRVPIIYRKPGACFPIVNNNIRVYAYEIDHLGKVIRASIMTIHYKAPLCELRDKYAAKYNIFPHEIDMFYDDKEVFDDDTCSEIGIEHEQIIRMHVTIDTLFTKNRDGESF
ncbi:Rad60/SUMO-like domain-containing protein [Caenorhabditis elegans]|uniref:Rad60/SUMO-like domain-containing protein n=1 Tax=Caenorhabditis elegans TaxID=6239 RepID=Q22163_CAEEL|nr:Rad60/SUMO-like domain-containing protein [Caenorhabditis elegans]CAA91479.2 Rad60/SUMO-like domain-containing protein [Caenorhabditis elegans]